MIRVEHVLDSWRGIREDTALAVEDFQGEDFTFRATPETMAFRDIARHVLNASEALVKLLLDGEDDFSAPDFRRKMAARVNPLPAEASPAELAAALRESIAKITADLAARDAEFFGGMMTRFDGQRVTRLEMVQYVKEHELTHRSQLFMCLRLRGIVPATTRRRLAKQSAK
jgi:uncharacterized damage-inducible protein DinB